MSITKCPGHMRSLKLNFSATVLTLGLKAKFCQAKFWGELRTHATFDRCEVCGCEVCSRVLNFIVIGQFTIHLS